MHYVLPLRWSLFFALSKKQWADLRERHKKLFPDWERCSCPKRCKANTLDENWRYDQPRHTKVFVGTDFICPGCHWLKSPAARIKTWLKQQDSSSLASSKAPHIIDCLGWTQDRVEALRKSDLREREQDVTQLARLDRQVQEGQAARVPAPVERLSPQELATLVTPGQLVIVPWQIDLSALAAYGYAPEEIAAFEQRMYQLAAERMAGRGEMVSRSRFLTRLQPSAIRP
jgi:hypothetical protein